MKTCVKFFLKAGDAKGYPTIQYGEKIPKNDIYIVNPHRVVKPRSTTCQQEFPFLRPCQFVLSCGDGMQKCVSLPGAGQQRTRA